MSIESIESGQPAPPTTGEAAAPDDAELVSRIASGDRGAERALIRRYSMGVWAIFAHWRVKGAVEASDLYQDTWKTVISKIRDGEVHSPAAIKGLILTTARYVRNNAHRSERLRDHSELQDDLVVDSTPPAAMLIDQRMQARMVRQFLRQIPPRHRDLLFLYFIAERSRDELCAMFDITPAQLWRRLHKAKGAFRDYIMGRMPPELDDDD